MKRTMKQRPMRIEGKKDKGERRRRTTFSNEISSLRLLYLAGYEWIGSSPIRDDDPTRVYLSWKHATRCFRIWNKESKYSILNYKGGRYISKPLFSGRIFISNGDAIFSLFISFLYFIPYRNSYRRDSAKCIHGYSADSSFPRTTNESRLIASVQSYLIVINRAGRMLIVAVARCDFVSIWRAPNICIRLINGAKDSANPPTEYQYLTLWMRNEYERYFFAISNFLFLGELGVNLSFIKRDRYIYTIAKLYYLILETAMSRIEM